MMMMMTMMMVMMVMVMMRLQILCTFPGYSQCHEIALQDGIFLRSTDCRAGRKNKQD